ncbi:MAG: hypothetical protein ACFFC7_24400 [Candidatus Hermodarchaeota archaeon]
MYLLQMEAEITTPIVTKKPSFYFSDCKAIIRSPRRRVYSKINTGQAMFPYSYYCYLGRLEIHFKCASKRKARKKIGELLEINSLGRFQSEGMGIINWVRANVEKYQAETKPRRYKVKIRKGLPHNLTKDQQDLIKLALLHDFVHTSKHKSKIYREIELENSRLVELLKLHHEETDDPKIQQLQKYDRIASIITRKVRSPRLDRYNWQAKAKVDFEALGQEITKASTNVWKLYQYIYNSKQLDRLNESLNHGHTSLRYHLLLVANLLVQNFQHLG